MIRTKPQWIGLGIAIGAGVGAALTSATHMGAWLPIGIGVGLAIGSAMANRQAVCPPARSQTQKAKS